MRSVAQCLLSPEEVTKSEIQRLIDMAMTSTDRVKGAAGAALTRWRNGPVVACRENGVILEIADRMVTKSQAAAMCTDNILEHTRFDDNGLHMCRRLPISLSAKTSSPT